MEKRTIDPWKWGEYTNSAQAVEVKQPAGTLYCSGQVAMNEQGQIVDGDMRAQLIQTFQNVEQLISEAGYECKNIVRLNVFTTSTAEFFTNCVDLYQNFTGKHGIKQATTLIEVKGLFQTATVELEATVVK
jgi:enamine deaminase RidA (YjgF/YER057c/UK114 family)